MSRKFKFRVWYKEESRWIETPDGLFFKYPHSSEGEYFGDFINDPYIPQQFTGVLDKDGKEIYEGDIIQYQGTNDLAYRKPGIVSIGDFYYDRDVSFYGVRVQRVDMKNTYFGLGKNDKYYAIIGNIFENPKLLK